MSATLNPLESAHAGWTLERHGEQWVVVGTYDQPTLILRKLSDDEKTQMIAVPITKDSGEWEVVYVPPAH